MQLVNLSILAVLALNLSCGQRQTVPNIEGCVQKTRSQAFCNYTNAGGEQTIQIADWSKFHQDRISFSISDFGKVVSFIEKSCLTHKDCDYEGLKVLMQKHQRVYDEYIWNKQ